MDHLKSEKPADWVVDLVAKEAAHMALKGDVSKADWLRYAPPAVEGEKPGERRIGRSLNVKAQDGKESVWIIRHILHKAAAVLSTDVEPVKFDFWIGQEVGGAIIWFQPEASAA